MRSSQASSASSKLDVLTRFKGDGGRLYGETCPQYLDLTNQEMLDHGPLAKIGPPLREPGDNEAMWRGLAERLIDTVGSDFCGFNKSQKYSGGQSVGPTVDRPDIEEGSASIFDASFGGNWAEQMLRSCLRKGSTRAESRCPAWSRSCARTPRRSSDSTRRKASCSPAPTPTWSFSTPRSDTPSARSQHCLSDFTMFEGKEVLGKPVFSMQRGETVIEDGELKRAPGKARFLPGNSDLAAFAVGGHALD